MTTQHEARPAANGTGSENFDNGRAGQTHRRTFRVRTAHATAYPPVGRRSMWLLLVRRCPVCRGAHLHRGAPHGGLRRAGCGKGAYLVVPVQAAGAGA